MTNLWQVSSSLDVPICGLWALSGPNELLVYLVFLPCAYCLLDQLNLILGRLEASQLFLCPLVLSLFSGQQQEHLVGTFLMQTSKPDTRPTELETLDREPVIF